MKKLIDNQYGVTLIETVAATAIIMIIMITVLGALLYGQKMIVFSDSKNNEAAQAQELVDEIMKQLSKETSLSGIETMLKNEIPSTKKMGTAFDDGIKLIEPRQYYIVPIDISGNSATPENAVGFRISVRIYYNNGESHVDLKAFSKKGGVNI